MSRDLGLALTQNLNEIADTNFAPIHKIEQTQSCTVSQGGKQRNEVRSWAGACHGSIIYALTDMLKKEYIRFGIYEETAR